MSNATITKCSDCGQAAEVVAEIECQDDELRYHHLWLEVCESCLDKMDEDPNTHVLSEGPVR